MVGIKTTKTVLAKKKKNIYISIAKKLEKHLEKGYKVVHKSETGNFVLEK